MGLAFTLAHEEVRRARFGHRVGVRDERVRHQLDQPGHRRRCDRRRSDRQHLDHRPVGLLRRRVGDQQLDHRRNEKAGLGSLGLEQAKPVGDAKLRQVERAHSHAQRLVDEREAGEGEDGARVQPRPSRPLWLCAQEKCRVAVPDRHALRRTRSAGRVEDLGKIVGVAGHLEVAPVGNLDLLERLQPAPGGSGDYCRTLDVIRDQVKQLVAGDDHRRLAVPEDARHFDR